MQGRAEDFTAVVGAVERRDDVARDRLAHVVVAKSRFIADARPWSGSRRCRPSSPVPGHAHSRCAHAADHVQLDTVTSMSAAADHSVPSFISATASTCCVPAMRMRADTWRLARCAGRGASRGFAAAGSSPRKCGCPDVVLLRHRALHARPATGTTLPFSARRGNSSFTRPFWILRSPKVSRSAAASSSGVAAAGRTTSRHAPATSAPRARRRLAT